MPRVLITGGAGFIGSNLAIHLAAKLPDWEIVAFDNLHRRGSELNLPRLQDNAVRFVHGDVRSRDDLYAIGGFDVLIECSAEPSVMVSMDRARSVIGTNLLGVQNCLEKASIYGAQVILLSSSRVYPLASLRALDYTEMPTRFLLARDQDIPGASMHGISEDFPLNGARTLYGATKLAAELLITEYAEKGLSTVINRCGVITGPWQMGQVDQGVFAHWMLAHYFKQPLAYFGFGATGKQVRDILHVNDLSRIVHDQLMRRELWAGKTINVGGGAASSLSLHEATDICREITGYNMKIGAIPRQRDGDVPIYISDTRRLNNELGFGQLGFGLTYPGARDTLDDVFRWIKDNERDLKRIVFP